MSKRITKKSLPFFFAFIALTQFSFSRSMLRNFLFLFSFEKSNKKTIEDLPDDCLYGVFKFLDWKSLFNLKLVSVGFGRVFENVIEKHPCFSVHRSAKGYSNDPLHYLLKHENGFDFTVGLHNEKAVKKFVEGPFLSKVSGKDFRVRIKLNEKNYLEFLAPQLKKLLSRFSTNNNKLANLQINYNKLSLKESISMLDAKPNKVYTTIFRKKSISAEELKTFGAGAKVLEIKKSKNSAFELPNNVKHIAITDCPNFIILKNGDEPRGGMLERLTIDSCKNFTGEGLKLDNFNKCLIIRNCTKFDIKLLEGVKNLGNLKLWGYERKNFPEETLKNFEENKCKIDFLDL